MTTSTTDARTHVEQRFADMADGDLDAFRRTSHPAATNRESENEPPACRVPGPEGIHATALWLRGMFSDLHWDVHEVVADGELVAVHATMTGRHTGPFTKYGPRGNLVMDRPPTGRTVATTQSHWFRFVDGLIIEHWANRDDLGMATQLGFLGPPP